MMEFKITMKEMKDVVKKIEKISNEESCTSNPGNGTR